MAYRFLVLYPVNPVTAARTARPLRPAGPRASLRRAGLPRVAPPAPRQTHSLAPEDPQTRQLARLLEHRRGTVDLRTLLCNMLRDALKSYYPQALTLAGQDLFAPLACQFLLKWPSLQELQRARKETVRKFYYAQRGRRLDLINQRLEAIGSMIPLTSDQAVLAPAKVQVTMLARQLFQLAAALKEYDARIEQLFASHADAAIWESFPGAGPTLAPRLCSASALNAPATRVPSLCIQQYSGIAPVTERSEQNQHWVHRRWNPPRFPSSELLRIRQPVGLALPLGQTLPPRANRQRQNLSHSRARSGLQMAAHHVRLLARSRRLPRVDLSRQS